MRIFLAVPLFFLFAQSVSHSQEHRNPQARQFNEPQIPKLNLPTAKALTEMQRKAAMNWITELGDDSFAVREKAFEKLIEHAKDNPTYTEMMRAALAASKDDEQIRRLTMAISRAAKLLSVAEVEGALYWAMRNSDLGMELEHAHKTIVEGMDRSSKDRLKALGKNIEEKKAQLETIRKSAAGLDESSAEGKVILDQLLRVQAEAQKSFSEMAETYRASAKAADYAVAQDPDGGGVKSFWLKSKKGEIKFELSSDGTVVLRAQSQSNPRFVELSPQAVVGAAARLPRVNPDYETTPNLSVSPNLHIDAAGRLASVGAYGSFPIPAGTRNRAAENESALDVVRYYTENVFLKD